MKKLNLILIFFFLFSFGISAKEIFCWGGSHIEENYFRIIENIDADGSKHFSRNIKLSGYYESEFTLHVMVFDFSLNRIEFKELKNDFRVVASAYGSKTHKLFLEAYFKNKPLRISCDIRESSIK